MTAVNLAVKKVVDLVALKAAAKGNLMVDVKAAALVAESAVVMALLLEAQMVGMMVEPLAGNWAA